MHKDYPCEFGKDLGLGLGYAGVKAERWGELD